MCRWIAWALLTLISVVPLAAVPAQAAGSAQPSLELGLRVDVQLRDKRDVPVFHVSIRNVSERPVQVVDVRVDDLLSWDQAPIDIRPLDPMIRLRTRSGLAYYDAPYEHMMTLAPGEGFQYIAEPNVVLEDFVQGRYRAQLRYAAGPFGDQTPHESPVVEFEIVNAPPPSAALRRTPLATEEWLVECGQFNEQRTCMIDYFSPGFETELPQPWFLGFIWQPDLRITAHQHMSCDGRPVTLKVDDNEVIEMEPGYSYHLSGAAARAAVEQFLAGTTLTMRIHLPPDCQPRDEQIPLDGFAAAWATITANAATVDQADLPALSVYGNAYSDEIAQLRMYRTEDRELRFYNVSQLSGKRLIFQSQHKDTIARLLQAVNLGPPVGQPSDCGPPEMDYQLHVVTLRADGRLFGYFVVSPSYTLGSAPTELSGNCARVTFFDGKIRGWHSYDFFPELRALGIL